MAATDDFVILRQWGRGQTAAESLQNYFSVRLVTKRQWGRGQTAAESVRRIFTSPRPISRQWGRGQTAAESRAPAFAATVPALRQWGRGQTAAERRTWATPRIKPPCVNGAAAKRPRKARGADMMVFDHLASMGPRPNGRGKLRLGLPRA